MLKRLRIHNLAVVADATLEFGPGLNILTGSTGAGKSLVMSAVNLLLGERAGASVIRRGEDKAQIEAVFVTASTSPGLDPEIVVTRELTRAGRSHATIGGRAVPIGQLREFCRGIIEPHGQNEQYTLRDPEHHLDYLDAYARPVDERAAYDAALSTFREADTGLRRFDEKLAALREKQELLEHRVKEIDQSRLEAGEMEALEQSLRVMEHAERISTTLAFACQALYDDDAAAVASIAQARKKIDGIAGIDETLSVFATKLTEVESVLSDAVDEIRAFMDRLEYDPADLERAQERVAALKGAERKYAMPISDLIERVEEWREELATITFSDERRRELLEAHDASQKQLIAAGAALSKARKEAARTLDKEMTRAMGALMMKGATFRTAIEPLASKPEDASAFNNRGCDDVHFVVRTNPGEDEGGLDRIASTGELSRVALALKEIASAQAAGRVLIFDEIDAGVGADLGDVLADKLLGLARRYQIVCITHMAQIAARGSHHLVVEKRAAGKRTEVVVAPVAGTERQREVARMLGGEKGMTLAGDLLSD